MTVQGVTLLSEWQCDAAASKNLAKTGKARRTLHSQLMPSAQGPDDGLIGLHYTESDTTTITLTNIVRREGECRLTRLNVVLLASDRL